MISKLSEYIALFSEVKNVLQKLKKRTKNNARNIRNIEKQNLTLANEIKHLYVIIEDMKDDIKNNEDRMWSVHPNNSRTSDRSQKKLDSANYPQTVSLPDD